MNDPTTSEQLWSLLTKREQETALMLAVGKTAQEAAKVLGISSKTTDTYRLKILSKLSLENTTQLAHLALAHKWVSNLYDLSEVGDER
jgi:DNA-binding CsgD family transcriptional regulator